MKKLALVFFILFSMILLSQENKRVFKKLIQKSYFGLDFLSVNMPTNPLGTDEPNMGLTGLHYNLWINNWSYAGIGLYGSVSGKRGGLFTLGINAGIKKKLSKKIFLDLGLHFGGGGGAGAPDGGGAFILPHINLGYEFANFSIAAGYSYVNFFDGGTIKSHQLHVSAHIPISFDYATYNASENTFNLQELANSKWNQKSHKSSLLFHVNNLSLIGKSQTTNGISLKNKTIRLAGFEINSYVSKNWFVFFRADGAYHGIPAGYMDVFLGGGYHVSLNKNNTNILLKSGLGAGGGGGVDTKGGFLTYHDISLEQKLLGNMYISLNKGYVVRLDNHFASSSYGIGFKYYTERGGIINDKKVSRGKFKGFKTIIKQDLYFNAKRNTNPTENLHQISLQLNFDVNRNFYLAGQTSFANFGNAGAYAEGIVGLGIKSNTFFKNKTIAFAQVLTGAAGGGNISTGQGLIIKPSLGINYKIDDKLGIRSSVGYVKARGGKLSSPFLNFGLTYQISWLIAQ